MCNQMCNINLWAVLVSGLVYFFLGAIWYSPVLFAKAWMAESKVTPDKSKSIAGIMISTFLLTLFMVLILAAIISGIGATTLIAGLLTGFICAIGFVATTIAIGYFYEGRSIKLFLINFGYHFFGLLISGAILGAWR